MRHSHRMMMKPGLCTLVISGLLMLAAPALAQRPAPGAVIDEVARYTGLTNDAVSLALKDNAAALGRLTDAVLAVQIAQRFLDARDADIATDVFAAATDTAAEALLPPPLMAAIKAVRVYKTMLEAARDKIVIPALDRQLYAGYRAQREQNQDQINAFSYATSQSLGGGYFSVKPKMVEEYIANYKDWNPDLIGEPMRRRAERQVDRFWIARFEATYQQEKAKPQKQATLAAVWASVKDITDQLKAPAGLNAGLFPDPSRDLPAGWWWVRGGRHNDWNWGPRDLPGMAGPAQERQFLMSSATGYSFNAQRREFCRPERNRITCDLPTMQVGAIVVRLADVKTASENSAAFVRGAGYVPLGETAGVLRPHEGSVVLHFSLGAYDIHLTASGEKAAQVHLPTLQHFAQIIAARIRAEDPSLKSAMPF